MRRKGSWPGPHLAPVVVGLLALVLSGLAVGGAAQEGGERDWRLEGRLEGAGVVVLHDPEDSLRAEAVLRALEGQPPLPALPPDVPRDVTAVLAPDEETFRRASGGRPPEWSAAVALPSLGRMVIPAGASERSRGQSLARVLRHEWAHLGLRQALPGLRVPRWFDEGYAQWAAGWDRQGAWRLRVLVAMGRTPPLDSLALAWPGDRASVEGAYLLAATAVEYLVDASGERGLEVFLEVWRQERNFETALRRVYGVTSGQLEEDWRNYVKSRYGWLYVLTHSALAWALLAVAGLVLWRIRLRRDRERMARLRAVEPPERPAWWLDEERDDDDGVGEGPEENTG